MKKVLIAGCSFVQRMGPHTQNEIYDGVSFKYASFGGQGLWKIEQVLKYMSEGRSISPNHNWNNGVRKPGQLTGYSYLNDYDYVIVQLPGPMRNNIDGASTTERIITLVDSFEKIGKEAALRKNIDDYKQKIKDINTLHNNIIFFWYNVAGVPFKHPINYGDEIIKEMHRFFEDYNFIHLSFEGKPGYHFSEEPCDDEEFIDYWYKTWPPNLKGKYNDICYMPKVPGTLVRDGHPGKKADLIALKKIYEYVLEN